MGGRARPPTSARTLARSAGVAGQARAEDSRLVLGGPGFRIAGPTPEPEAFARVRGLTLYLPPHVLLVAYHEASFANALPLNPLGLCVKNANPTKFTSPLPADGPRYVVMSSRGRPTAATSAVDLAIAAHRPVLAPVTGRVLRVRRYLLYGKYWDLRIVLALDHRPDLRVVMIHLSRLRVRRGSPLVAGVTVLGYPRVFPFVSEIDHYVGAGTPHVHLEVKARGPSRRQKTS